MKTLRNLIENIVNKTFKKQEITLLGRWKVEHCKNKTDKKIDLANQDNCGPCGHYKITTIKV